MIIETIVEIFVQVIIEGALKGFFKLYRKLGILALKIITFDKRPFKKLDKEHYKDSSKPYFVSLIIIIGSILLFI